MIKKELWFKVAILLIVMALICPVNIKAVEPRASDYLEAYSAYIYPAGWGKVQVWFSVDGTSYMDELGALQIQLYESKDNETWTWIKTYQHVDYADMLAYDDFTHMSHVEHNGTIVTLSVNSVCKGIFSLLGLAFIAGGINVIYQIEKLPLMLAILIHGCVLYLTYLVMYLINDWLAFGVISVLLFTGIFIVGFVLIWVFIYFFTKRSIKVVNEEMSKRRK